MSDKSLHLSITALAGQIVNAEVESVSLPGTEGAFTVLYDHAPLIASLTGGEIVFVTGGAEQRQKIAGGLVRVLDNKVEACIEEER